MIRPGLKKAIAAAKKAGAVLIVADHHAFGDTPEEIVEALEHVFTAKLKVSTPDNNELAILNEIWENRANKNN